MKTETMQQLIDELTLACSLDELEYIEPLFLELSLLDEYSDLCANEI